jgi:hypothetical protein
VFPKRTLVKHYVLLCTSSLVSVRSLLRQIVEFDDVTIDQFTDALATVKGSGMEGLILDLRGNPGGSLDAVVKIDRKRMFQITRIR